MANVLHGVVESWAREFPDDELIIVVRRKYLDSLDSVRQLPPNVFVRSSRLYPQALLAMFAVPFWAWRTNADAMLTNSFAPMFGRRRAAFLQDAIYMTNPEWFTRVENLYFRWMARLARRADVVFASSQTEASRIASVTSARRVVPVGIGLDPDLVNGPQEPDPTLHSRRFLLLVGRLNVRKNLGATLEGARLSGILSPSYPAVVVGESQGEHSTLPDWVDQAVESGAVRFLGFVSSAQLSWLMSNCGLFVNLSLDEGFGLPPVEARVAGAEVLVSDIPVFRETLGVHANYVDATNPAKIGREIFSLVTRVDTPQEWNADTTADILTRYNWPSTVRSMRAEFTAMMSLDRIQASNCSQSDRG